MSSKKLLVAVEVKDPSRDGSAGPFVHTLEVYGDNTYRYNDWPPRFAQWKWEDNQAWFYLPNTQPRWMQCDKPHFVRAIKEALEIQIADALMGYNDE